MRYLWHFQGVVPIIRTLVTMVHTVNYGTETIRYRGQRIWHSLPQEIKDSNSVQQFKNKMKCWYNEGCDCRLFCSKDEFTLTPNELFATNA